MGMDDATWRRHANPWSGYTRFLALPLLALAIWSRVSLGWGALAPIALVLVWIWWNPRAFAEPPDFGAWMSRGVLGERLWLARDRYDIAPHHRRAAWVLTAVSALGLPPFVWGLWALDFWAVIAGMVLIVLGKTWFLDRMVWIHADLTGSPPGTALPDPTLPDPTLPPPRSRP